MSSNSPWPQMTLKSAGVTLIDCDHRTPPAQETGHPYIAIPQLKDGHICLDGSERKISDSDLTEWTKKLLPQEHDVIVVRRCSSGDSAVIPPGLKCAIGQNLVVLRADGSKVFPPFLRWLARSDEWREQVRKYLNVGAVFDSLKCREIPLFELPIPPLSVQSEISSTLKGIDDRITLLRETNATLESIAQALFKSWFVDFDPVRAKQEGRVPDGMDESTAALFADGFEESELGLVPKGWQVGTLGSISRTAKRQLQASELHADLHYVGLEHIPRKSISLNAWGRAEGLESAKSAFAEDDILFGKLRPYFHKVVIAPFAGVCSTDILVCQPTSPAYWGLAAMHLYSVPLIDYADRLSNGAKMPRVNWKDLAAYPLCVPPTEIANRYNEALRPIIARMKANIHQAQTLATLRDTLLPRLISGQLRIPEAEQQVDEVVV